MYLPLGDKLYHTGSFACESVSRSPVLISTRASVDAAVGQLDAAVGTVPAVCDGSSTPGELRYTVTVGLSSFGPSSGDCDPAASELETFLPTDTTLARSLSPPTVHWGVCA